MKGVSESRRNGLYRSRQGVIFGVCRGMAETLDFSVFWTRVVVFVSLFFTGIWPVVGLYCLAALLMKPEPVLPLETEEEREFYDSYVHSRQTALDRLKRTLDDLDRRIRRVEHIVTEREVDWERRLNE